MLCYINCVLQIWHYLRVSFYSFFIFTDFQCNAKTYNDYWLPFLITISITSNIYWLSSVIENKVSFGFRHHFLFSSFWHFVDWTINRKVNKEVTHSPCLSISHRHLVSFPNTSVFVSFVERSAAHRQPSGLMGRKWSIFSFVSWRLEVVWPN